MYANDHVGDCTTAAAGHMIEAWTAAAGRRAVEVPEAAVLAAFDEVKVVDPASGEEGAVELVYRVSEGKNIEFRTQCDDESLVDAYRRALCIVLPSVYRSMYGQETTIPELLGQTLLEGVACVAPAICTHVASMPEVVRDQVTGFVVPPNDPQSLREKILWLREHRAEAVAMGQAARCHVLDRFTWPAVVRDCLEIYSK